MKAEIEKIGTIENGALVGWTFNCKGCVAIAVEEDLIAGWSLEELQEIVDSQDV